MSKRLLSWFHRRPLTPDLIPLIGARNVRAVEPDERTTWQDGLIKELTVGEPISVKPARSWFNWDGKKWVTLSEGSAE